MGGEIMGLFEGFIYGVFGGVFSEVLGLFKMRREASSLRPEWIKSPFYWIITGTMILAGGGLVFAYLESDFPMNAILALNVGASAPLILENLAGQVPKMPMGRID